MAPGATDIYLQRHKSNRDCNVHVYSLLVRDVVHVPAIMSQTGISLGVSVSLACRTKCVVIIDVTGRAAGAGEGGRQHDSGARTQGERRGGRDT